MKYTIIGTFINGEQWEDSAKNKKELEFVLNQAYKNGAINNGSVKIINKKGEDITEDMLAKIYGEEEIW